MRRLKPEERRVQVGVTLDPRVYAKIEAQAKKEEKAVSWIIANIVEEKVRSGR